MFVCICVYIKGRMFFFYLKKNLVIGIRGCNWSKLKYYFSQMCFIWIVKWNNIFHKENNLILFFYLGVIVLSPLLFGKQINQFVDELVHQNRMTLGGWVFFFVWFGWYICMQSRALTRLMAHGLHHQINTKKYIHKKLKIYVKSIPFAISNTREII